jgi:hypothetical protein
LRAFEEPRVVAGVEPSLMLWARGAAIWIQRPFDRVVGEAVSKTAPA